MALDLVHSDLCGPITPTTPGGKKYFLLLADDMSRFMWIHLITGKNEAAGAIKQFKYDVEAAENWRSSELIGSSF
jgi:hypothetical protein